MTVIQLNFCGSIASLNLKSFRNLLACCFATSFLLSSNPLEFHPLFFMSPDWESVYLTHLFLAFFWLENLFVIQLKLGLIFHT